jgi:hypothetical protein
MDEAYKRFKTIFFLATVADIVADPSAPSAFVSGIMEGKEWVWDNGVLAEVKIGDIKHTLVARKFSEKAMLEAFDRFMKALSTQHF